MKRALMLLFVIAVFSVMIVGVVSAEMVIGNCSMTTCNSCNPPAPVSCRCSASYTPSCTTWCAEGCD